MSWKLWAVGEVVEADDFQSLVQNQVVQVYADAAARTTALGDNVAEGMLAFLSDTDSLQYYSGSAWLAVSNPGDITSVVAGTALSGGGTSGDVTLNVDLSAVTIPASQISDLTATAAELNILDGVTSDAAELNILDGVTATSAELNILDGVTATSAEINILDGVTATSAEINILDGVTADATELNYVDGVTSGIQSQLDDKALLTPAVNAKTAAYTLAVGDRGETITADGTFTLTAPSATFSAGDRVDVVNIGTGVITFAGSGVTINPAATLTIESQWSAASILFLSSSTAVLIGDIA